MRPSELPSKTLPWSGVAAGVGGGGVGGGWGGSCVCSATSDSRETNLLNTLILITSPSVFSKHRSNTFLMTGVGTEQGASLLLGSQ